MKIKVLNLSNLDRKGLPLKMLLKALRIPTMRKEERAGVNNLT